MATHDANDVFLFNQMLPHNKRTAAKAKVGGDHERHLIPGSWHAANTQEKQVPMHCGAPVEERTGKGQKANLKGGAAGNMVGA